MITKKQNVEYLLGTPKLYTCPHMAGHLKGVSHDVVNDFLQQKRLLPRQMWQVVKERIADGPDAFLVVGDSVHDKRYAHFIELIKRQHRVIQGFGGVNLVHSNGEAGDF